MEPFELDVAEYLIRWIITCGVGVLSQRGLRPQPKAATPR